MTRESLLLIALQSGALFLVLWGLFKLLSSVPANAKAWIWRLAFLKPLLSLLPMAAIPLRVLPAPPELPPMPALDIVATPVAFTAVRIENTPTDPWLLAWYIGAGLAVLYGLWGTARSRRIVARAQVLKHPALEDALYDFLIDAGVRRPVELLSSQDAPSAMLVGGLRYSIVLPTEAVAHGDFQDLRMMVAHEVAHIARKDLVWFGLTSLVRSLFFFNPLVWIAARCSRLDHESATDRHAAHLAGVPIQTYADMLLRATVVARGSLAPGALPVAESYRTIHRRLEAMKHFNAKPTFGRRATVAALALCTCALLPMYQLAEAQATGSKKTTVATAQPPKTKLAQVTKSKAKQPVKADEYVRSYTSMRIPVSVKVDKKGVKHYFVKTKKGYVEVDARDLGPITFPTVPLTSAATKTTTNTKTTTKPNLTLTAPPLKPTNLKLDNHGEAGAREEQRVSIDLTRADVREALRILFKTGGKSYAIAPEVQGLVTAKLDNIGFETALQTVVSQVGARYRVESGVYQVALSPVAPNTGELGSPVITEIMFDRAEIGQVLRAIFARMNREYILDPSLKGTVTCSLKNVPLNTALQNILYQVNGSYTIEDGVYKIKAQ